MFRVFLLLLLIIFLSVTISEDLKVLWKIDLSSVTKNPYGLSYDWNSKELWVGDIVAPFIYRITTSETPKVTQVIYILNGPSTNYGIAFKGVEILLTGNDKKIYLVDIFTGKATLFRSAPQNWYGDQPLAYNYYYDVIYTADWESSLGGWAKPAKTGNWYTWQCNSITGFGCSFNEPSPPKYLWAVDNNPSGAKLFVYDLADGTVKTPPKWSFKLPSEMSQSDTADCAFDGERLYVVDRQENHPYIYVLDVERIGIETQSIGNIKALFK
ncbi:MAG: hypothetical protein ACUVWP_02520 [bacterium]